MAARKRQARLKIGDRARSKLNRRVGTVDAVDKSTGAEYGLHYDEAPQDRSHDGRTRRRPTPAGLIERE